MAATLVVLLLLAVDRAAAQCDVGAATATDAAGARIVCGGSQGRLCPGRHYCKASGRTAYCCPTREATCSLPLHAGNEVCPSRTRWAYSTASGRCIPFTYLGCFGNTNNFLSRSACTTFCATAIIGDTFRLQREQALCLLTADAGVSTRCSPLTQRWGYDRAVARCVAFGYRDCGGNANNFGSAKACLDYCADPVCPFGEPLQSRGAVAHCTDDRTCPRTHRCTESVRKSISGVRESVGSFCCQTLTQTCSLPGDSGRFCGSIVETRFRYDPARRRCESFSFRGCGGNSNNFATNTACSNVCLRSACEPSQCAACRRSAVAACPRGQTLRVVRGSIGYCTDAGQQSNCPAGFSCVQSELLRRNVCCGATHTTLCPRGSAPYMDELTLLPAQCQGVNVDNQCAAGYFCFYPTARPRTFNRNTHICCRSLSNTHNVAPPLCPLQHLPATAADGGFKFCSPQAAANDLVNGCEARQICQYVNALGRYICCGTDEALVLSTDAQCPPTPRGLRAVVIGSSLLRCHPFATEAWRRTCPGAAACLWSSRADDYLCCEQTEAPAPAAAANQTAALLFRRAPAFTPDIQALACSARRGFGVVLPERTCSPFQVDSCAVANNHQCLWNFLQQRFVCCRPAHRPRSG